MNTMNEGTNQHNGTERNGTRNGTTRNMEHRIVGTNHFSRVVHVWSPVWGGYGGQDVGRRKGEEWL
jgi:hypothetical protein